MERRGRVASVLPLPQRFPSIEMGLGKGQRIVVTVELGFKR